MFQAQHMKRPVFYFQELQIIHRNKLSPSLGHISRTRSTPLKGIKGLVYRQVNSQVLCSKSHEREVQGNTAGVPGLAWTRGGARRSQEWVRGWQSIKNGMSEGRKRSMCYRGGVLKVVLFVWSIGVWNKLNYWSQYFALCWLNLALGRMKSTSFCVDFDLAMKLVDVSECQSFFFFFHSANLKRHLKSLGLRHWVFHSPA